MKNLLLIFFVLCSALLLTGCMEMYGIVLLPVMFVDGVSNSIVAEVGECIDANSDKRPRTIFHWMFPTAHPIKETGLAVLLFYTGEMANYSGQRDSISLLKKSVVNLPEHSVMSQNMKTIRSTSGVPVCFLRKLEMSCSSLPEIRKHRNCASFHCHFPRLTITKEITKKVVFIPPAFSVIFSANAFLIR